MVVGVRKDGHGGVGRGGWVSVAVTLVIVIVIVVGSESKEQVLIEV